ncbi:NACHT, LRR and PYD domains-containing protein 1b allele 1-like isoform X2 [Nerophis ophidion]|nr:NACHT, LRR and PYD domains-containing protein 1b allele 1-like isoform X2 [Nerophis ophidion]XP_061777369.1 NACHT, LRR and PYD domains-containing protein 1b allele 1-like isoform X2 [Nerophis ophidion]XP_061777370.1 NACHT, LRR and PYD domains-containing protein 1b allele 1-like isoform X2 [Nerophis ophidion]
MGQRDWTEMSHEKEICTASHQECLGEKESSEAIGQEVPPKKCSPVPDVTLCHASQMGLTRIKTKIIPFSSWLSRVLKHLLMCVTIHKEWHSEPGTDPGEFVFSEQINELEPPDPAPLCSDPLLEISACASEYVFLPSPHNVFTHEVQVESLPVEQTSMTYSVTGYPHVGYSVHNQSRRPACLLPRSHSTSVLRPEKSKSLTRSASLIDMFLKDFEHFTPDVTVGGKRETYRLECFRAGRYQCTVTGLVFHMDGEGDVRYGVIPWDLSLLAQHHKKPAGPLFDIQCDKPSMRQLHLPHCEIPSMGGCSRLLVAHVSGEGMEVVTPQKTTDTHVIANITGFSAFGLMRSEDTLRLPIRALVLVFLISEPPSVLNVLLVSDNEVVDEVIRVRSRRNPNEAFVNTISGCTLVPEQRYVLTSPLGDMLRIQPSSAAFCDDLRRNFMNSFQVLGTDNMDTINLALREYDNPQGHVWYAEVPLRHAVQHHYGFTVEDLRNAWSGFVHRVSRPVLGTLVDRLFQEKFLSASERDQMDQECDKRRKARAVLKKMINLNQQARERFVTLLREEDPHLAATLGW